MWSRHVNPLTASPCAGSGGAQPQGLPKNAGSAFGITPSISGNGSGGGETARGGEGWGGRSCFPRAWERGSVARSPCRRREAGWSRGGVRARRASGAEFCSPCCLLASPPPLENGGSPGFGNRGALPILTALCSQLFCAHPLKRGAQPQLPGHRWEPRGYLAFPLFPDHRSKRKAARQNRPAARNAGVTSTLVTRCR